MTSRRPGTGSRLPTPSAALALLALVSLLAVPGLHRDHLGHGSGDSRAWTAAPAASVVAADAAAHPGGETCPICLAAGQARTLLPALAVSRADAAAAPALRTDRGPGAALPRSPTRHVACPRAPPAFA